MWSVVVIILCIALYWTLRKGKQLEQEKYDESEEGLKKRLAFYQNHPTFDFEGEDFDEIEEIKLKLQTIEKLKKTK